MKLKFITQSGRKGCIESDNIRMCTRIKKEWLLENNEKEKLDKK